jgi:hypothetical protein
MRAKEITVSQKQGLFPITILHLSGALDGTTYQTLIEKAKQVYQEGARDLFWILTACPTSAARASLLYTKPPSCSAV